LFSEQSKLFYLHVSCDRRCGNATLRQAA